jgi:hypothetical protein
MELYKLVADQMPVTAARANRRLERNSKLRGDILQYLDSNGLDTNGVTHRVLGEAIKYVRDVRDKRTVEGYIEDLRATEQIRKLDIGWQIKQGDV